MEVNSIIQALLLSSGSPLTAERLEAVLAEFDYSREQVQTALAELAAADLGVLELVQVASGYRLQLKAEYNRFGARLLKERAPRYPRSVLETLAIIAYRQPITRAEIEQIRGVHSGSRTYQALLERGWIRGVGRKDSPGRPELLATTKAFLDHFQLNSLKQLPSLPLAEDATGLGFAPEPEVH